METSDYERTDRVDVFLSTAEIPREHRKIGEIELELTADQTLGQTQFQAQREARRRGAHAVVIEDQALATPWLGSAQTGPRRVMAYFYRYGSAEPVPAVIVEPEIDPATTAMPEKPPLQQRQAREEMKPRWEWWWNREKSDDTLPDETQPEPEARRIDPTGNAVFTGDVDKLEQLGLPEPNQTVLED